MNAKDGGSAVSMAAMEKAAWFELIVSATTIVLVLLLIPVIGNRAAAGFSLLGISACSYWFFRRSKGKTIVDERDRLIEAHSKRIAVEASWGFLVLALIAFVFLSGNADDGSLTKVVLNWLIWIQFAILIGANSLVSVIHYRRQSNAS